MQHAREWPRALRQYDEVCAKCAPNARSALATHSVRVRSHSNDAPPDYPSVFRSRVSLLAINTRLADCRRQLADAFVHRRRAFAPNPTCSSKREARRAKMPSKKKKYNSRFPPARIKKIMQADEEVGKVAAVVPVIICE